MIANDVDSISSVVREVLSSTSTMASRSGRQVAEHR
jgi:hypothetical protein